MRIAVRKLADQVVGVVLGRNVLRLPALAGRPKQHERQDDGGENSEN